MKQLTFKQVDRIVSASMWLAAIGLIAFAAWVQQ